VAVRILIADDQQLVRSAIAQLIRNSGEEWEVCCEVEDGQAAVEKVLELKPDLVILDFMMPGRDGISAGREIHTIVPEMPIVLFTSFASASLEVEAKSVGIEAVVPKSEGSQLLATIRKVFPSTAASSIGPAQSDPSRKPRRERQSKSGRSRVASSGHTS